MKERTLVLVKPDAVQRALTGDIISRIERTTLKVIGMKMVYATPELAGEHYAHDEDWFESVGGNTLKSYEAKGTPLDMTAREVGIRVREMLMEFISMAPVVALVIEGHNAVKTVRKLVGATSPEASAPGTIRGDYTIDSYELADTSKRAIQNLIHASGSPAEAEREINIWFKDEEVHAYMRVDEALIYRNREE